MNGIPSAKNECVTDETRPLAIFAHFDVCAQNKTKTNTRTKTKTGNPDDEGVTNLDGVLEHSVIQLFVVWLIISSLY